MCGLASGSLDIANSVVCRRPVLVEVGCVRRSTSTARPAWVWSLLHQFAKGATGRHFRSSPLIPPVRRAVLRAVRSGEAMEKLGVVSGLDGGRVWG